MCIILQRWFQCQTRQGEKVRTEQEKASTGESHHRGKFLIPCSTPPMIPPLDRSPNATVADKDILPCYGAWDERVEWYDHPCPTCRGEEPYLLQGAPVKAEWRPYLRDNDTEGHSDDPEGREEIRRITERVAESLAKTIYCWVDMHWSRDLLRPNTADAPDLARQILSTCSELGCIDEVSHGPQINSRSLFPDNGCTCGLNEDSHQRNVAMRMRRWMNNQTETGYHHLLDWAEWQPIKNSFPPDFDLRRYYDRVPASVWNRNPFFQFVPVDQDPPPGQDLQRDEHGQGPLFGLDAAMEGWMRRIKQARVQRWADGRHERYPVLEYCEPWTENEVAIRFKPLHAQISDVMRSERFRGMEGACVSMSVLLKVADILAHDSGLADYRIKLVMDHFLQVYKRTVQNPPTPASEGTGTKRPPFQPPYVDALFCLILANASEFVSFAVTSELNMTAREKLKDMVFDEEKDFPYWLVVQSADDKKIKVDEWRKAYWTESRRMRLRAKMITDHIVKYVPGLLTSTCTSCNTPDAMEQSHRGSQLCRTCRMRTGYQEGHLAFGDQTFLDKIGELGPIEKWSCLLCAQDFNNNGPPFEWPAEIIRCHGRHRDVVGSRCLKLALFAMGTGDANSRVSHCMFCRGGLCVWDENILRQEGGKNDDDIMDPRAHYALYHSTQAREMSWGFDSNYDAMMDSDGDATYPIMYPDDGEV